MFLIPGLHTQPTETQNDSAREDRMDHALQGVEVAFVSVDGQI